MDDEKQEFDDAYWDSIPEVKVSDTFSASFDADIVNMFLKSKGGLTHLEKAELLGVSERKVRRMLSGQTPLRMYDLEVLAKAGFNLSALSLFITKQLVVVPRREWEIANDLVQEARKIKDDEPESPRPYCPSCAHND